MILKLTPRQLKELKPLFDKATKAHARGQSGVIMAQPFGKDNPPKYSGIMNVVFIRHDLAFQVYALMNSNKRQIVKK